MDNPAMTGDAIGWTNYNRELSARVVHERQADMEAMRCSKCKGSLAADGRCAGCGWLWNVPAELAWCQERIGILSGERPAPHNPGQYERHVRAGRQRPAPQ